MQIVGGGRGMGTSEAVESTTRLGTRLTYWITRYFEIESYGDGCFDDEEYGI